MALLLPCLFFVWLPITASAQYTYTPCDRCNERATKSELANISFCIFPNKTLDEFACVPVGSATKLLNYMDPRKSTLFYIYGFTESIDDTGIETFISAYLTQGDQNVVLLNWSKIASKKRVNVYQSVPDVGPKTARGLNDLVAADLNSSSLLTVGYGLGAHVAGLIGRNVNFTLPIITGFDPARSVYLFSAVTPLMYGDATYVQIYYTSTRVLDTALGNGDVNIYFNWGALLQPGCPVSLSKDDFCSHRRSVSYYIESMGNKTAFIGRKCSNYLSWTLGLCSSGKTAIMGYGAPTNLTGNYYLQTNSASPYGLGIKGATYNSALYLSSFS